MSEKSRKSFTSQHKAKVALEAIRGTKTLNEIAQEFAVHPTQVGEWKKVLLAQAPGIFDSKRGPKPDDPSASPERLRQPRAALLGNRAVEDGTGLA